MAKTNTPRPSMGDLIKQLPATTTPIQEVRPVAETPKKEMEDLVRFSSMWIPPVLAKRLKVHAAESGKTIREISIDAFELYFAQLGTEKLRNS